MGFHNVMERYWTTDILFGFTRFSGSRAERRTDLEIATAKLQIRVFKFKNK